VCTVNSVQPGRIDTEQIRRSIPLQQRRQISETKIPLGEFGEPEDLAVAIAFLASPRARYITGVVLRVEWGIGPLRVLECHGA